MVTSHTIKTGLICWPIGHSLSPVMHNSAFEALGMDWVYLPLAVEPDHLEDGIRGLKSMSFAGCNVSVPFKTRVIPYLDELDEHARMMNAVNTIKVDNGKLYGFNTDAIGFIRQLKEEGVDPEGMSVLMIGAGGAARAALFGLAGYHIQKVSVLDVAESQMISLKQDLSTVYPEGVLETALMTPENLAVHSVGKTLVVNATPIGMLPKVDASPWPESVPLPKEAVFFDIVYNPPETAFLRRAKAEGHQVISGLGMLVNQGAASFEIWTGRKPPLDIMYKVCREALSRKD